MLFVSRKYDVAISRVRDLIDVSKDDQEKYCYIQVFHAKLDRGHVHNHTLGSWEDVSYAG